MRHFIRSVAFTVFAVVAFPATTLTAQGPPFQTDDPEPVDYGHYEFYIFGTADGTPVEVDQSGPSFEFNWGALPNLQLHAVLPLGSAHPMNHPAYLPSGQGSSSYGLTDMEFGAKYALIRQSGWRPQIGTFPMLEVPTGDSTNGLGVGRVWYKLPLWVEKDWEHWSTCGGAGYQLVKQAGYSSFPYGGWLVKRSVRTRLEVAAEIFSHGSGGSATAQIESSTMIDAGGYYHFKNPHEQLLFAYGHSITGQTENYAYLGLYWTWGKDKKTSASHALLSEQANPDQL
jgi:hypothetical protein